ncbi:MAG: PilZ domain-containing protein [Bryobacteraceae bacterium]
MHAADDWDETIQEFDTIAGDRRRDKRYELQLDVRWKLIRRRRLLESGEGRTLDVSSGGILFDAGRPLPAGLNVELSVTWPVMLHNVAPLQLLVYGKIVRSEGRRTAVRMMQHEFRTAGAAMERRLALANGARSTQPLLSRVGGAPGATEPR